MSVGEYIRALLASERFGGQVTHHRLLPEQGAVYGEPLRPWSGAVAGILERRGIAALFCHQAEAADRIRAGRHVVVATPTASGKSLIYNLPVIEQHVSDPDARALYLFPLKALARDQAAGFRALTEHWPEEARPAVAIYDGDTTDHFRRKIRRDPPAVLITNPEMLHLAILPHHEQWTPFLAGLSHVVVDEAHTYRGVLGAHMAQLFRRLNRIAGRYGARPTYVFCTATVGNPGELAGQLMGCETLGTPPPDVITVSGAPRGARHFVFVNPEDSPSTAAIALLKAALARGLRTIVYCRSRRMTELVGVWAAGQSGQWKDRISAYRAGFLPEERRDIEERMASGQLLAVISTSALELGIDIGSLDVCILVGYPGTVMSTLQRGGRVGRACRESAVILVAGEDALDQYFVRHPEDFFSRPPERAVVNPGNEVILKRHLECAAAEQALTPEGADGPWLRLPETVRAVAELERQGVLLRTADGAQLLAARKRPQRHVDLRGSGDTFSIQDAEGTVIGFVDGFRAWRETHPGAVYLHRGVTYVITALDPGSGTVRAEPARVSWFTRVRSSKSTEILEITATRRVGCTRAHLGRLRITETITGYEKRAVSGNRLLTIVPLDVPPHVFETEGLWFEIPDDVRLTLEERFLHFMGAIHALEHAAIGMLPLLVMADRNDFGGISTPMHAQVGLPAVFIYDGLPGGAGLSRLAFEGAEELLRVTRAAVVECPCDDGCPSCVHSPKCGSGNRPISKAGAAVLLEALLRPGDPPAHAYVVPSGASLQAAASVPGEIGFVGKADSENGMVARVEAASPLLPGPRRADPWGERDGKTVEEKPAAAGEKTMATEKMFLVDQGTLPTGATSPGLEGAPAAAPQRYMVLDVETRRSAAEVGGWHCTDKMGVSVAVLYDAADDSYTPYEQDALSDMFARLREADSVIGFNIERFDYAVLQPFARYRLRELPTLDLLHRVKERLSYRVSLDNLAQATLGEPKSADGLQALRWWKEGNLEAISAYCRKDVEITRRIYLYGLEHGFLLFTNKAGQKVRVPVDFSGKFSRVG